MDPSTEWKLRKSADGIHLFHRATGVNVLIDDVSPSRSTWSPAPTYVSIALTNACDLSCTFCYAPKRPARVDRSRVLTWLRELDHAGCLGVGFGGGEPTLYPRFVELCREAHETTRLAITFTTHGHHITSAVARQLDGAVDFIRVSVDGVAETYERFRGRPFSELRSRLDDVASICPFGINTVVNEATSHELGAVASLAAGAGASELLLLPEQPTASSHGISASAERRMREWILGYRGPIRISISEVGAEPELPLADPFTRTTSLQNHAHVDASGCVARTAFGGARVPVAESILAAIARLEGEA